MAYLKDVASISLGNDGTYILTIDPDCYMDNDDCEIGYDDDELVFSAKDMEELKSLLDTYLTKVKHKSAEEVFNKIKI